jgi:hypothetical protein
MQADVQGSRLACVLESAYSPERAGELVEKIDRFARRFEEVRQAPRLRATGRSATT